MPGGYLINKGHETVDYNFLFFLKKTSYSKQLQQKNLLQVMNHCEMFPSQAATYF